MSQTHTKCLIIGSGPAGFTAAIYASRAGLQPIVYEGYVPGGLITTTSEIENFPGYPEGTTGFQLMEDMRAQATRFGATIRSGRITEVNFDVRPFTLKTDTEEWLTADTVILATGAKPIYLGLPDEDKFKGMGISVCATCDGFFYRRKVVAVVGGGDTAAEEAMYLSSLASKVHLIVRKPYMRASKVMQTRVMEKDNIEVHFNTVTLGFIGDEYLEGLRLVTMRDTPEEKTFDLPVDGLFVAIGHKPETDLFKQFIELDERGYVKTHGDTTATNVPGVFVAGDVADWRYRQAIVAAGAGARAALDAETFLMESL